MAAVVVLAVLIAVGLPVPGFAVSALSVAAVALVVVLDRFHKPTDAALSQSAEKARSAETAAGRS